MFYLGSQKLRDPQQQDEDRTRQQEVTITDWQAHFAQLAKQTREKRLQAFYRAGVVDAQTPLKDVPLLALDVETTGLNPRKNSIVSLGMLPMTLNRIRCSEAKHWIVNPLSGLNNESVAIHGITHSAIKKAPDLEVVLDDLLETFRGHVLVVHHRGIERPFLDVAIKTRLGEGLQFPVIDTMELEARLHRQKALSWWKRLLGQKPASIRLADSRARYGLPWYRPHHALNDALATAELLQAQIAYRFSPDTPISELWV
ncbi:3'-5' exonuclease [Marinospirillum perlucidum]|uniref:3'-5' exonuclease n=1 Tax=Marinospirillum perlucidum TaxID=1982602 RepID=UPI000DF1D25B|nr:3'-5' exonuclease [Marinospirillum perlucidum]